MRALLLAFAIGRAASYATVILPISLHGAYGGDAGPAVAPFLTPMPGQPQSTDRMPDPTPAELTVALDRLVDALHAGVATDPAGPEESRAVREAVHACAAIARAHGIRPEQLIIALKPLLASVATRIPDQAREGYLRAVVTLAIESYFGTA